MGAGGRGELLLNGYIVDKEKGEELYNMKRKKRKWKLCQVMNMLINLIMEIIS